MKDEKIESLIETKFANEKMPKSLHYFYEKYGVAAILLVQELKHEYTAGDIVVRRAKDYLMELFL